MIDSDFVERLKALSEAGDKPSMWALLKGDGQMARLIALAARGVEKVTRKKPEKKPGTGTHIPESFPTTEEKQKAVAYWNEKRRPDLVARVEEIGEGFFNHHFNNNKRFISWPMAWRTWYVNEVHHRMPPRGFELNAAPVVFEQTGLEGWVTRLMIYSNGDPENRMPKGFWGPRWGLPPSDPRNSIPPQAVVIHAQRQKGQGLLRL